VKGQNYRLKTTALHAAENFVTLLKALGPGSSLLNDALVLEELLEEHAEYTNHLQKGGGWWGIKLAPWAFRPIIQMAVRKEDLQQGGRA